MDVADASAMMQLFREMEFDTVVHLAAQAGVRYSLQNAEAYVQSNLVGFCNLLECIRRSGTQHLLYASSSSVYGDTSPMPFSTGNPADHPVSLYAATKRANELIAHSYSHLFEISLTGLRFFTVYGRWGRPDMAYWSFTERILRGTEIQLFNNGQMLRDFTYVDDVVESVMRLLSRPPQKGLGDGSEADASFAPWRVLNVGNAAPIPLEDFVNTLEQAIGRPAKRKYLPMQPGDVVATHADVSAGQLHRGCTAHANREGHACLR